ncbi:hypothetical protein OIO90_002155 [Microbotryomycetes sp. JL221]|nr:hypothetical protein OIO90_002155 [Microbotryomycetes sp. JL221]
MSRLALHTAARILRATTTPLQTIPSLTCTCHLAATPTTWIRLASSSSTPARRPLKRDTQIKDEQIPFKQITLVNPETSQLMPPASLRTILNQLDRTRFSILLVDKSHEPPICKILDKKQQYEKQKAKDKAKKEAAQSTGSGASSSATPKEIQLTWSTTAHDLSHKLNKAKDMLAKGSKVLVVIKSRKGAEATSQQGKLALQTSIEAALRDNGKLKKKPEVRGGMCQMEFGPE